MMLPYFSVESLLVSSVIVLILVIACMDLLRKIKFRRRYAKNTPVVSYLPLIGTVYIALRSCMLTVLLDFCKDYESFYIWIFTEPYYVTCDPDDLQIILNHQHSIEKGSAYRVMKSVLHDSMILSPESVWRRTRKAISKMFQQNVFNTFIPRFNELSDEYIQTIQKDENTGDLLNKNTAFFFDTFFYSFLKSDMNEKLNNIRREFKFHEASRIMMDSVIYRLLNPLYYFDCIYKLSSSGSEFFRTKDQMIDICTEVIQSRRMKRMELSFSEEMDDLSIVDLLDECHLDFQNMVSEISFISGAAVETSGTVLTYAMAILGKYEDIQEKVYEEVMGVTGNDGMIDKTALKNMKYTKMVLSETMRLFTPLPMILRQVTEDLDLNGKIIPKGTNIAIHLMALHRNEKHWKDPMRFDPNKFSAEEVQNRHPYSFAPFSAGPRNCVGWKYANMIGTTILGKIVRKYKISSNLKSIGDIDINSLVLLNIPKDIKVTFTPRYN